MAEIQEIGYWFFGSDRVATIITHHPNLKLWATPLPFKSSIDSELDIDSLRENFMPSDIMEYCVVVDLAESTTIVCDIPDNYALYIGDENGEGGEFEGEGVTIHWSKR